MVAQSPSSENTHQTLPELLSNSCCNRLYANSKFPATNPSIHLPSSQPPAMKPTARLRFLLLQASTALALLVNHATAATFTWDGSDTAFWNLTANWVGGVAPVSANTTDIIISGTANVSTMLPGAVSYTIKSLTFDATNDADVRFTMTSTTNVSQSARNLTFNSNSGNATLAVESGSTGNKTIDRIGTINPSTIRLCHKPSSK